MVIVSKKWTDMSGEAMSAESIARIHVPAQKYRIKRCEYEPGVTVVGATISGSIYIIRGEIQLTLTTDECQTGLARESLRLKSGHVAEFVGGEYSLEVESPGGAIVVFVWEIPEF